MLECVKRPVSYNSTRRKALSRWRSILEEAPECFDFGLQLVADVLVGATADNLESFLKEAFSVKASKTLLCRSAPLVLCVYFCKKLGRSPCPFTEGNVYSCVCCGKASGAAPTRASSLISALDFSRWAREVFMALRMSLPLVAFKELRKVCW